MKIYKEGATCIVETANNEWYRTHIGSWDQLINRKGLYTYLSEAVKTWERLQSKPTLMGEAPIQSQEVWAAGVTYLKSKIARMEEAEAAGGGDFYDRVYDAARPEIFFKATAARTVGHDQHVYIRRDSTWDVPEPELVLFICSEGTIEGYSIGNDMSSRSIEGENPLYLPQAKTYEKCAGLGPCILVKKDPISPATKIHLKITRAGKTEYNQSVEISQMKRTHTELAGYLYRECDFPRGVLSNDRYLSGS